MATVMAPQVRGLDAVRDVGWLVRSPQVSRGARLLPREREEVSAGTQYARDLGKLKGVLKIIFGKLFVRGTLRRLKTKFSPGAHRRQSFAKNAPPVVVE
jgi:hypothetical protein